LSESGEIRFSKDSENYCLCIIDIVNSTFVTAQITNSDDIRKYYSIFINTMATIARNFEGKVIKNSGDSVIYYFPNTFDTRNECAFRNALECCLTMLAANTVINDKMYEEALPQLNYRVSSDYGNMQVARSNASIADDFFGTTVNICAKINKKAAPNTMIIGGDLYLVLKSIPSLKNDYKLKPVGYYSVGIKQSYPLYSVSSKYDNPTIGDFMQIPYLKPMESRLRAGSGAYGSTLKKVQNDRNQSIPRVMLVDDDKDILTTFEILLNSQNIGVDKFSDSSKALKQFALSEPDYYDLVILDIRMPVLNGLQLYYRLKALNNDLKTLFISALDASEELLSILPGIQLRNILKKPVDKNYFISTVKELLFSGATEGGIVTD
jgi:two-component system, OmpR family, response regulator ChvI